MLPAEGDRVAAARARVNEEIERQPLARAERPAVLEGLDVGLAPGLVAGGLADLRPLHAGRRIGRDHLLLDREARQPAERRQPRLLQWRGELREQSGDVMTFELAHRLVAVLGADAFEVAAPIG